MSRFVAFVWKELLELSRDRVLILFVLYAFTLDVIGDAGLRLSLNNARMQVQDHDRSTTSRELIGRFAAPYFNVAQTSKNANDILAGIDGGSDMVGLVIPPNFEADLARGERVPVQLFLDGSRATHASLAEAYTREIVANLSQEIAGKRLGWPPDARTALPVVEPALRVRFNENREESYFMGINTLLMQLALLATLLAAAAFVREREHGTIEQLLVSPLEPWEILLAKTTASTVILLVATALTVFGVLLPILEVPVRGSLVTFFACTVIFVFTMSGLGMAVASFCRTMPQVGMVTILLAVPVLFLFSGSWTPPEAMPSWLARATALSPLRWFNEIAFGLFLRGATLRDLVLPIGAMTGLGALFFLWGTLRVRAQFR